MGLVPKLEPNAGMDDIDDCLPRRRASTPPDLGELGDAGPRTGEKWFAAGPQGIISVPFTMGDGGLDESMPFPARG